MGVGSTSVSVSVAISSVHRPHHALLKYYLAGETINLGESVILDTAGVHDGRLVVGNRMVAS